MRVILPSRDLDQRLFEVWIIVKLVMTLILLRLLLGMIEEGWLSILEESAIVIWTLGGTIVKRECSLVSQGVHISASAFH